MSGLFERFIGRKIIIVGEIGSGKTLLLSRFLDQLVRSGLKDKVTVIEMAPNMGEVGGTIENYTRNRFLRYSAALMEPIGTVLIGGTFSVFIFAPAIGDVRILGVLEQRGALEFLPIFWFGWSLSSVPGSILGYMILLALDRSGVLDRVKVYMVKSRIQARRRDRS